jgi:hypothetical protein
MISYQVPFNSNFYISFIWGSSLEVFVLNATGAKQKEKYPFICVGNTLIP